MDLMGLCHNCGKPGANFTCILCGKIVCISCFDNINGLCLSCKMGKK